MEIRFNGGEAEDGRLELYTGSESLSGLGRVASMVTHYVATGNVRFRGPYSEVVGFYITGVEEGSLRVIADEFARLGTAAASAAAKLKAARLFSHILARGTGQAVEGGVIVADEIIDQGTVDALAEAATPGLLRAHRWIDSGAKSVTVSPDHAPQIAFNENTREYLETEILGDGHEDQDVSVGALNVNARSGRVFFHDLGRTVPFYVSRDATAQTIPTLARFLSKYAEKDAATVNIEFLRVSYPDGRLKRIIVFDSYSLEEAA